MNLDSSQILGLRADVSMRTEKLAALQKAITAGRESGDAGALNMQSIKQQARPPKPG